MSTSAAAPAVGDQGEAETDGSERHEGGAPFVQPVQSRDFRQNFRAGMDEVIAHRKLLEIRRGDETIGYVVPETVGALLLDLRQVRDLSGLERWLLALRDQAVGGEHLVHSAVVAHLAYVKDRGVTDAISLSQMETCLPASRDGRTVALQFGQPGLVGRGILTVLDHGRDHLLQGSFEVEDPTLRVWLELPNGQTIDRFERHGPVHLLPPTRIDGAVELLFAWFHFRPGEAG